jgi:hypothetical protein
VLQSETRRAMISGLRRNPNACMRIQTHDTHGTPSGESSFSVRIKGLLTGDFFAAIANC